MSEIIRIIFWDTVYDMKPNSSRLSIYEDRDSSDYIVETPDGGRMNHKATHKRNIDLASEGANNPSVCFDYDNKLLRLIFNSNSFEFRNTMEIPVTSSTFSDGRTCVKIDTDDINSCLMSETRFNITNRDTKNSINFSVSIVSEDESEKTDSGEDKGTTDKLLNPVNETSGTNNLSNIEQLMNNLNKDPTVQTINDGASRVVYYVPDKSDFDFFDSSDGGILKLARSDSSADENRKEFQTWQAVEDTEIEEYFCPISNMAQNHSAIVMDKVDVEKTSSGNFSSNANRIKEVLSRKVEFDDSDQISLDDDINDEFTNKSQLTYQFDINSKNIGIHSDYGYVLIDYPFGARVNIINNNYDHITDQRDNNTDFVPDSDWI